MRGNGLKKVLHPEFSNWLCSLPNKGLRTFGAHLLLIGVRSYGLLLVRKGFRGNAKASEQIILPELPAEGLSPVRRTGHAQQQRQLLDNVYGNDPVGTEILTDAA